MSGGLLESNIWTHIAVTMDNNQARFFVNGIEKNSSITNGIIDWTIDPGTQRLGSGKWTSIFYYFDGDMAGFKVSDIGRYENDFIPPSRFIQDANTVLLYSFLEGTGNNLQDLSGNNNHGIINGATWQTDVPINPSYSYLWSNGDTTSTITVSPTETTTYTVTITDGINTCTDEVMITLEHPVEVELTAFLEGPFFIDEMTPLLNIYDEIPLNQPYNIEPWNYSGTESVAEITSLNEIDWVLVEMLIPAMNPDGFEVISQRAGFILADGSITDVDGLSNITFNDLEAGDYFIRIHHRNHLQIISSVPVTAANGVYSYDFSTDASKVLGGVNSYKELNADLDIWGMVAGDGDADGQIDNNDKNDVWLPQRNTAGYHAGDFDMNRQVSDVDKNSFWEFNAGKGIPTDSLLVLPSFNCGDPLIDARDGQSYNTVQIGEQCWMAENLNVGVMINASQNQTNNQVIEKFCYGNNESNCDEYGGLYQWNEMMQYSTAEGTQGICPSGWYIPTDEEWKQLEGEVDSQYNYPDPEWDNTFYRGYDAGGNLKETGISHWSLPNTGATNSSGFNALPGGKRSTSGVWEFFSEFGFWWSSTESGTFPWRRYLDFDTKQIHRRNLAPKYFGFSVRCLKD